LKDWLPPVITRTIRRAQIDDVYFEGNYTSWEDAATLSSGYDNVSILNKVLEATLKVKRGEVAFERDSVTFDDAQYSWLITTGLMWAAAQGDGRLDVLDFGGALGSSYFQNRVFLSGLRSLHWSVVEQGHYAEAGRNYIQDETLRFYSTINDCLSQNTPNVILLSSVIQYLPNVDDLIAQINNSAANIVIIDRTPFNNGADDKICIQNVPKRIYQASYPMRVFSMNKLLDRFNNWDVVAEKNSPEGALLSSGGIEISFQGLILRRNL
jgi:putative methyltransferase (TIGR04325 family)